MVSSFTLTTPNPTLSLSPHPLPPTCSWKVIFDGIRAQIAKGAPATAGERFVVRLALVPHKDGEVVCGAVVVRTVNLRKETAAREGAPARMPFDLLETVGEDTLGAHVVMLKVLKRYRRHGIASRLLIEAMQEVLSNAPSVQVVFTFAPRGDEVSEDFLGARNNFTEFGFVRGFRGGRDYSLWAQSFHRGELARYAPAEGDELPDLFSASLKRIKPVPRWLVDLGLQFGLPVLIVAVLFGISYLRTYASVQARRTFRWNSSTGSARLAKNGGCSSSRLLRRLSVDRLTNTISLSSLP